MKGCKYIGYIKWLVALALTLMPILVLGAPLDTNSSPLWDMFQNLSFTPPSGDMSVAFLAKMFGSVPGVPSLIGAGTTVIGVVFGVFNAGVLALSGTFLGYTVTKVLTETTMDGSAMGKGSANIWLAVRCALSTSLLVPQASGYSMINSIVMWVVIQSIGLADTTWITTMKYLKSGGPAYAPPQAVVDYSLINYDTTFAPNISNASNSPADFYNYYTSVGSADVLRSLTCAYVIQTALANRQAMSNAYLTNLKDNNGGKFPTTVKSSDSSSYPNGYQAAYNATLKTFPTNDPNSFSVYHELPYKCAASQTEPNCSQQYLDGAFQFPYIKNEASSTYAVDYGLKDPSTLPKNLTGMCGTISYILQSGGSNDTGYAERANRYTKAKRQGLLDMIAILEPVAKKLVSKIKLDADGKRALDPSNYVVYVDDNNVKHLFLKDPNTTVGNYLSSNQTVTDLWGNITNLPNVTWPLGGDEILTAAAAYQVALAQAQQGAPSATAQEQNTIYDNAAKQGWIAAGNYYRVLAAMQNTVNFEYDSYRLTGYQAPNQPFSSNMINNRDTSQASYYTLFKQATTLNKTTGETAIADSWGETGNGIDLNLFDKTMTWIYLAYPYAKLHGVILTPALSKTTTGVSLSPNLNVMSESDIFGNVVGGAIFLVLLPPVAIPYLLPVPMQYITLDINNIFNDWNTNMGPQSANLDPILKLQNVGNSMVRNSLRFAEQLKVYFEIIVIAISTMSVAMTITSAVVGIGSFLGITTGVSEFLNSLVALYSSLFSVVQTIIFMYIPVALAVLGPILVSGLVFSIYVPLIPYLLFLFGVISWLISVLVLMAAAPIICFLMLWGNSSQENPLLAREAEQFLMQVIAVFFRPTLMIIGLVTGMVLSYIGVDILNLGFNNIVAIVVTESSGSLKLIQQVGVMVVYTFTMVAVVNMCFSTIHLLYSEAMRIVGITAPAVGMEEKHMEGVKGGVTAFAEPGAAGVKEGATALKGAAAAPSGLKFTAKPKKEKKKEESGVSGEDTGP